MDTLNAAIATIVLGAAFIGFPFLCSAFVSLIFRRRQAHS